MRFSLTVRHTLEFLLLCLVDLKLGVNLRIIVIDLIIMNRFGICLVAFLFKEKDFPMQILVFLYVIAILD